MRHLIWLGGLLLGFVLVYQGGAEKHSEGIRTWAEGRCERATDSHHAETACKAALDEFHGECLREGYRPPTRYNRVSEVDTRDYWSCMAKRSPAAPPLKPEQRLQLSDTL